MGLVVIRARDLGKLYQIGPRPGGGRRRRRAWLRAPVAPACRGSDAALSLETGLLWALREVSFDVHAGEVVGIVGPNGAGKSTLLKILSRITEPTTGRAELRGSVRSLLEVGTGFHPDLTGRENIYLNGAILGMRRREIARKFDEIVGFAEIEPFLDVPVKRYSSGMYVRLAFAVAAHLQPDILVVDEVLAVGDAQFQSKCLGKMEQVAAGEGRTILFVSHNLATVEGLCRRGLVLNRGRLAFDGPVKEALRHYLAGDGTERDFGLRQRQDRVGNGRLRFTAVRFCNSEGPTSTFLTGQEFRVEIEYEAACELANVSLSIPFYTVLGQPVFMAWTRVVDADFATLPPRGILVLRIPRLPLRDGGYVITLYGEVNGLVADWVKQAARFDVRDGDYFGTGRMPPPSYGPYVVEHEFFHEDACVGA